MAKEKKKSAGDRLMDGAVGFGKFQIWVGIILFGFIGTLLLLAGIWWYVSIDVPVEKGKAVVREDFKCQYINRGDNATEKVCTGVVSYQVNGKDYNINISADVMYLKGNEVEIEWEVGKPESAMLCCRTKNKTIGMYMIIGSVICFAASGLNYYFRNNEFYAAATGASAFMR